MTVAGGAFPMSVASSGEDARATVAGALTVYRMDPGSALHRAAQTMPPHHLTLHGPILDSGCRDGGFAQLGAAAGAQGRALSADGVACRIAAQRPAAARGR